MRRFWKTLAMGGLLFTLTVTLIFAQGRGAGKGYGAQSRGCPYGMNGANPNAGGWWARVNPSDAGQKAFVEKVSMLHSEIRENQVELKDLQAAKAPSQTVKSKQSEIDALRTKLHDLQVKNRSLKQRMMQSGGQGRGRGNCPMMGTGQGQMGRGAGMHTRIGQGKAATTCPQGKNCATCPYADTCPRAR
ncbi:MAG: hypothetical protein IT210_00035 [Armatimonadetes bacterium]|nr:hypothetical protein [Armatimonadota bacterium]